MGSSNHQEDNQRIGAVAQAGPFLCCKAIPVSSSATGRVWGYSSLVAQAESNVDKTEWDDFDCLFLLVGDGFFLPTCGSVVLCYLVMVQRMLHL